MSRSLPVVSFVLLGWVCLGCEVQQADAETIAAPVVVSQRSAASQSSATSQTPLEVNEKPRLMSSAQPVTQLPLFARPAKQSLRSAKAYILDHDSRSGVYFGLPAQWRYDDPSSLLINPRNLDQPGRFVALRLPHSEFGIENQKRVLTRGAKAVGLHKAHWSAFEETRAGRKAWAAQLATTEKGRTHGFALVVRVSETHMVGAVASWPAGDDKAAEKLRDIMRYLHTCQIEVGRGCVALP